MDLRALRYFMAIADSGSFTAAAASVRIAQPALSRHVRELEAELGVALLRRTARGALLTQEGATLYESARRILAEAAQVKSQIMARAQAGQATVTVGASPTLGRVMLPGLFERCDTGLSEFRISVREAFTPVLCDWIAKGLVDVALVTNPPASREYVLHPLCTEPFALVMGAARRVAPSVSLSELARIPLLMTSFHRSIVERQLQVAGGRLNIHAEIDSVDSIRELVLQGRWATLMPVSVFHGLPDGAVGIAEIPGVQLHRLLMLATRAGGAAAQGVELVMEMIRSECASLVARGVFSLPQGRGAGVAPR
jgi:DNA-binding transcriptional LysR family regulator